VSEFENQTTGEEVAALIYTSDAPRRKRAKRPPSELARALREAESKVRYLQRDLEKAQADLREEKQKVKVLERVVQSTDKRIERAINILEDVNGSH